MLKRLKQLWKRRQKPSTDNHLTAGSEPPPDHPGAPDTGPDTDNRSGALESDIGEPSVTEATRTNRHGIRVFSQGENPEQALLSSEVLSVNGKVEPSAPPVQASNSRGVAGETAQGRPTSVTNRHGIRVINDDTPLDRLFSPCGDDRAVRESKENQTGVFYREGANAGDSGPSRSHTHFPETDRHGIPILGRTDDLDRLFRGSPPSGGTSEEAFDRLLEMSLADASPGTIMRKKHEGAPTPRPLPVRRRIKGYPRPQCQLDLHGYTAERAAHRTDAFIRTAHANRRLTLRIIVGKGLHSENGPVLPDVVEDRLRDLKTDGIVLHFEWEKGVKRKSGAVVVYLNSGPRKDA